MPTSLQDRLQAGAQAYAPLTALIGSSPMRWYQNDLQQGSFYPAIVVTRISGQASYAVNRRMKTGFARFQFLIWGGMYQSGAAARDAVAAALIDFMDQWSGGSGITGLSQYSNTNVLDREATYRQKDSTVYQRLLDFMIFADDSL